MTFKKILLLAFCSIFLSSGLTAQSIKDQLELADSLFVQKKYTQSYDIYHHILDSTDQASPAMLLKMAYIREGLGDYSNALYFLNLYYLETNNKRALKKMEDLAKQYDLKGYRYTDLEFFLNIFRRYYSTIVLVLSSLSFLFFSYIIYKKKRLNAQPGFSLFYMILTLMLLFYMVNFGDRYRKGIIVHPNSYLMSGPSAGASLVAIADPGHRLKIKGKKDVWIRVDWEGKDAYIREQNIKPVRKN